MNPPLPPAALDDRTFEDLVREARLRIPRYTREWTDFNDSDPGMAIVQLFAWLTEQMLFQFNQVPARNRLAFLELLNLRPQPARPATAAVTFVPRGDARRRAVRVGTQLPTTGAGGQAAVFETIEPLDLVPHPLASVQVFNGADFEVRTDENARTDRSFAAFGEFPQVGSALYLGLAPPPDNPERDPDFPPQWRVSAFLPPDARTAAAAAINPPQLVWEFAPKVDPARWRPLEAKDDTRGFTQEGVITLARPEGIGPNPVGRVTEPRYWVRCRIAANPYPPGAAPRLAFLRTNTARVANLVTVRNEELQQPDGDRRDFTLRNTPVEPGSLQLVLEVPGRADEEWREVTDFFGADLTRDSAVYTLDRSTGAIRTGNGVHGRIPEPGGRLVARSYQFGGGAGGNVGPQAIVTPPADLDAYDVRNDRPAAGGQDAERPEVAAESAPLILRSRGQAVTAADFRLIAESVAGVARAVVRPCTHPDFPGADVPGAVTVVVVPTAAGGATSGPPELTPQLKEAVEKKLDSVRLIGTEVVVAKPNYVRVTVEVEVVPDPSAAFPDVEKEVRRRVRAALQPDAPDPAIKPPIRPVSGLGGMFYSSSLYEVILASADARGRLVSVVTKLQVRGPSGELFDKPKPIKPTEILWCDAVTVRPSEGRA